MSIHKEDIYASPTAIYIPIAARGAKRGDTFMCLIMCTLHKYNILYD